MNIKTSRGLAAASLLATAAVGLIASPGAADAGSEWKKERGNVIECHGVKQGLQIRTTVYENSRYGNTFQIGIGDPDTGKAGGRNTDKKFLADGTLKASATVAGKKAVVKGSAERFGARIVVDEQFDDGGYLIQNRGFQRRLRTDLVATYAGKVVPLTCDTAFFYDLDVKKTPLD
jgi:hypothetical protein